MEFIGRTKELSDLEQEYNKHSFVVIYGRRRIGKTALIQEFIKDKPALYFLATEESVCADNGFKYTCSGAEYSGGNGDSCGGKYKKCNCVSGYEWKGESCQKKEILNGPDGDVYKCNGSVVAVKASNMNFYIAMRDLENMLWNDANNANQKYTFCGNLKGNLPTNDQLTTLYRNKSEINNLLSAYGGFPLADDKYWSRDTYQADYGDGHYYIIMNSGTLISTNISVVGHISRPVLVP